jgi:hypothetical protein
MSDFDEKLRLKEKAEEDRYFARKNRELIQALHEERAQENQAQEQLADPALIGQFLQATRSSVRLPGPVHKPRAGLLAHPGGML